MQVTSCCSKEYAKSFNSALLVDTECDVYDYVGAAACGVIGGLVDIFLVGAPEDGKPLEKWADSKVDNAVMRFSKFTGWKPEGGDSNDVAHAIYHLEKNFGINYDQRHSSDVGGLFSMSAGDHHMKSLGHSPSIIGLFFSVLNQFTSTASFVDNGRLVTIKTDLFNACLSKDVTEFWGYDPKSKIICGVVNWLGHVMSDIAGSSVTRRQAGDGTGVPIPFFELFQFCDFNVGGGTVRKSVAEIAVQVFRQGYDARFGLALAVPVLVTDILTRLLWSLRRHFQFGLAVRDCMPSTKHDSLRMMLLVSNGSLCALDLTDAAIRSGGFNNPVELFQRLNILAWLRFTTLVLKEVCIRASVERDILAMREINAAAEAYLSDLRTVDLAAFECEVRVYRGFCLALESSEDEHDVKAILNDFYLSSGISKPWSGSFADHMSSPTNRLRFS